MRWRMETGDMELWMLTTDRVEKIIMYLETRIKEFEDGESNDPEKFARQLVTYRMNLTAAKAELLKARWIKRLRITKMFMERELTYRGQLVYRGFTARIRKEPNSGHEAIFADALEDTIGPALGKSLQVMAYKMRLIGKGFPCPPCRKDWKASYFLRKMLKAENGQ